MAQLRTIGRYIDNSGVDMCWVESDLYGPSTVKQIIDGKRVSNTSNTSSNTTSPSFKAKDLNEACMQGTKEDINKNTRTINTISSLNVLEKLAAFNKSSENRPIFKVILQYMRMVTEMLTFIRAVRTGDWELHLQPMIC